MSINPAQELLPFLLSTLVVLLLAMLFLWYQFRRLNKVKPAPVEVDDLADPLDPAIQKLEPWSKSVAEAVYKDMQVRWYASQLRVAADHLKSKGFELIQNTDSGADTLPQHVLESLGETVYVSRELGLSPSLADDELVRYVESALRSGYSTQLASDLIESLQNSGFSIRRREGQAVRDDIASFELLEEIEAPASPIGHTESDRDAKAKLIADQL